MRLITPRKPEQPILWMIAGPNASGKSSFYNRTDIEGWGGSVWIINPDLLTSRLIEEEELSEDKANVEALNRMYKWLDASIDVHQTIGLETVLSSDKYQKLVKKAKTKGYQIRMIYIVLKSAEMQLERARIRVKEGGHFVPEQKIIDRRIKSFKQLNWFIYHVDQCYIFDNSDGTPDLVGKKISEGMLIEDECPSDLTETLKNGGHKIIKDWDF